MNIDGFQAGWPALIIVIAASYLIGSIPFGLLIGWCHGVDIRKTGSGNIGATNVTRSVGSLAGKLCFLCDFLKGWLPVMVVLAGFAPETAGRPAATLPAIAAALAAVLGHMFPVFLRFKGGKGISTGAGAALALAPLPLAATAAVWAAVFLASRYVSLASVAAAAALPVFTVIFAAAGIGSDVARSGVIQIFFTAIGLLAIWKHRANLKRLAAGTESRFQSKSKP